MKYTVTAIYHSRINKFPYSNQTSQVRGTKQLKNPVWPKITVWLKQTKLLPNFLKKKARTKHCLFLLHFDNIPLASFDLGWQKRPTFAIAQRFYITRKCAQKKGKKNILYRQTSFLFACKKMRKLSKYVTRCPLYKHYWHRNLFFLYRHLHTYVYPLKNKEVKNKHNTAAVV